MYHHHSFLNEKLECAYYLDMVDSSALNLIFDTRQAPTKNLMLKYVLS